MIVIYKYPLEEPKSEWSIEMPVGAEILHIDAQRNVPCIWAKVDTDKPTQIRKFLLLGTGHPVDKGVAASMFHHGSFFMQGGTFVFHLFEIAQ